MPAAIRNPHHYNVLGLAVDATDEEIRTAYKKLVCFPGSVSCDGAHCLIGPAVAPRPSSGRQRTCSADVCRGKPVIDASVGLAELQCDHY